MTKLRQAEKVVKEMEGLDKPVLIITRDMSPLSIMMEMVKSIIPDNFSTMSIEEKLEVLESSKEEGQKLLEFENGVSRAFFIPVRFSEPVEIQVKIMEYLREYQIKKVFCDPSEVLFSGNIGTKDFIEAWDVYKDAICNMFDLEFVTITDDFGGKYSWL